MILMACPPSSCEIMLQLCNRQRTLKYSKRPTVDDPQETVADSMSQRRLSDYCSRSQRYIPCGMAGVMPVAAADEL